MLTAFYAGWVLGMVALPVAWARRVRGARPASVSAASVAWWTVRESRSKGDE